ncbi:F-box only protein 28 [Bradysia coprophila]|uniref:F-box only protein 28 n=1 Tax=Bradysia coprophila TaxID=38358 RepID=UPI00187D75AD|nr:F-box only protein 28 [Bradysia coprophila]
MNLLELPDCMLEQIFECLTYDEIAKKRLVSTKVNRICQQLLNRGFSKLIKRHSYEMKKIKSLLPRRESERRHHPLIKHADILTCIETRISMLSMTYTKYIDMSLCCFIPGKIIDEALNILRLVSDTTGNNRQLRAHEVLQELRDISSMAIDHFDEKIAHILKKAFCDLSAQKFGSSIYQIMQSPIDAAIAIQSDFNATSLIRDTAKPNNKPSPCQCPDAINSRRAYLRLNRKYKSVMRKLTHVSSLQSKQLRIQRSCALSMSQMNSQIVDLRRRLEESESKNREIAANFNQMAVMEQTSSSGNKKITRNIKPRAATIILKRRINEQIASNNKRAKVVPQI